MADPRFAVCLFCDDLRQEVGNKQSFMGVYTEDLVIEQNFPVILPKFAIVSWLLADLDDIPEQVVMSIILPDQTEFFRTEPQKIESLTTEQLEGAVKFKLMHSISFGPMLLPCAGTLEVWIETEREKLRAGRLPIRSTVAI